MCTAGKKAEVAFDDERPHEVWFPATVLKHSHKGTFQVEYQQPGSGDEAVLHKATVNFWHIRPSPPHLRDTDFGLDDEVDAYYDYGWWCGVITQELPRNRYSVFFEHSNKEREFICSKLRPHLEWEDGKWHSEGDTIFQPKP
ncbi:agenet domain-containing protein [Tanacetum coccineum]